MRKDLRQSIQRRARELLYSGQEPGWMSALKRADGEHTCGARCKQSGRPCPVRPEPGRSAATFTVEKRRQGRKFRSGGKAKSRARGFEAVTAHGRNPQQP